MTAYITDATVVAEFLLAGPYTANATRFFRQALLGDTFIVPDLCLNECTNVLWKAVRFRGMPSSQAAHAVRDLRALPLRRAATKAVLEQALDIGLRRQLAVYDSIYIALALRTQLPLVTFDGKQEQAARAEGVNIVAITDF